MVVSSSSSYYLSHVFSNDFILITDLAPKRLNIERKKKHMNMNGRIEGDKIKNKNEILMHFIHYRS